MNRRPEPGLALLLTAAALLWPTPGAAEEVDRATAGLSLDVANTYYFRGIVQETAGPVLQPGISVGFELAQGAGPMGALALDLGLWSSAHPMALSATGPRAWYEADLYANLGTTLFDVVSLGAGYVAYMSPNGSWATVHELGLALGYDDGALWGDGDLFTGLQPSLAFGIELSGTAFGDERATALELGLDPGFGGAQLAGFELTLPVRVGLGALGYYDMTTTSGTARSDALGYTSVGLSASRALDFIGESFGAWSATLGGSVLLLGPNAAEVAGQSTVGVLSLGVAASL